MILAVDDLPRAKVHVPEWKCDVWIRAIGGMERDAFEESSLRKVGKNREVSLQNIRARLVQLAACKEDGTPLFGPSDVAILGSKSAKALDRLFMKARELAGLSDDDVEELVKNSVSDPSEGSGSN